MTLVLLNVFSGGSERCVKEICFQGNSALDENLYSKVRVGMQFSNTLVLSLDKQEKHVSKLHILM